MRESLSETQKENLRDIIAKQRWVAFLVMTIFLVLYLVYKNDLNVDDLSTPFALWWPITFAWAYIGMLWDFCARNIPGDLPSVEKERTMVIITDAVIIIMRFVWVMTSLIWMGCGIFWLIQDADVVCCLDDCTGFMLKILIKGG